MLDTGYMMPDAGYRIEEWQPVPLGNTGITAASQNFYYYLSDVKNKTIFYMSSLKGFY